MMSRWHPTMKLCRDCGMTYMPTGARQVRCAACKPAADAAQHRKDNVAYRSRVRVKKLPVDPERREKKLQRRRASDRDAAALNASRVAVIEGDVLQYGRVRMHIPTLVMRLRDNGKI